MFRLAKCAVCVIAPLFGFAGNAHSETVERDDLTVEYRDDVPVAAAEMVADRVQSVLNLVRTYLAQAESYEGPPYSERLTVYIDPERFGPYQERSNIYLPEARVLNLYNGDKDKRVDLGIVHEVTHVLAASYNRKNRDRFFDDGLAVYLQHRFGYEPNYPNFRQDLYVAVAVAAVEHGSLVPLADAEAVRANRETPISRKLAYLEEGAFTQFLIEKYGLNAYFKIYHGMAPKDAVGKSMEELESAWVALIEATPTP